jgi:hypothetical protein
MKIKLVNLISNKAPLKEGLDSGLSIDQKKKMYEAMKSFSKFKKIYREDVTQTIKEFVELAEMCSKHMVSEVGDGEDKWFDKVTVGRHSKSITDNIKNMSKVYKEAYIAQQRLESLVEDTAGLIKKYYEVNEAQEL